uniref:mRNA splicing factor 3bA n=1 Tax=Gymnochlora stellata TaxID=67809 RepID=B5A4G0_GYMST|nr:mRNA splicing factor 3bA [Gymnochlora stellata]
MQQYIKIKNKKTPDLNSLTDKRPNVSYKRKKKIKQQNKLMYLKKLTLRTIRITSVDATSPDPLQLIQIKNQRKVIDIPNNWKSKKKYLLGNKKKNHSKTILSVLHFDTQILKKGKINFSELKHMMKSNSYKLRLLDFGQFYEESLEYKRYIGKFIPGIISDKLRIALGLSEFANPPWFQSILGDAVTTNNALPLRLVKLMKANKSSDLKYLNNFYLSSNFSYWA